MMRVACGSAKPDLRENTDKFETIMVHKIGLRKDEIQDGVQDVVRRRDVICAPAPAGGTCTIRLPAGSLGLAGARGIRGQDACPTPTSARPCEDAAVRMPPLLP
jgi:hypothetical protein